MEKKSSQLWKFIIATATYCAGFSWLFREAIDFGKGKDVPETARNSIIYLRDPSRFEWYLIPFLVGVLYVYFVEIGKRDWDKVFGAIAFFGMDFLNEVLNSLIFSFSNFAPLWGTPGTKSSFQLLIGWNIEIIFNFLLMGLGAMHLLLKKEKGGNDRFFIAFFMSIICVSVEVVLNLIGVLTWEYPFWNSTVFSVIPIFIFGYFPFWYIGYLVHDMEWRGKIISIIIIYGSAVGFLIWGIINNHIP